MVLDQLVTTAQVALQMRKVAPIKGLLQIGKGQTVDLNSDEPLLSAVKKTFATFLAKGEQLQAVITMG